MLRKEQMKEARVAKQVKRVWEEGNCKKGKGSRTWKKKIYKEKTIKAEKGSRKRTSGIAGRRGWKKRKVRDDGGRRMMNMTCKHKMKLHPATCPVGARDSFPGGEAARAWSWPLTAIWCRVQEYLELYLNSPSIPS
jgi:hypothetical protein